MLKIAKLISETGERQLSGVIGEKIKFPKYIAGEREIHPVVKSPNGNKSTVFHETFKPTSVGTHKVDVIYKDKVNGKYDKLTYTIDVYPRPIVYNSAPNKKKYSKGFVASKVAIYSILIFFAIVILIPFAYALSTSLTLNDPETLKDWSWIPKPVDIGNYVLLFSEQELFNIYRVFGNTMLYVIPPVLVGAFCSSLCAYATSRIKFKGHRIVFNAIIITMFIPGIIILAPSYNMFMNFYHWTGDLAALPLIIPALFGGAGTMFYLHQYFLSLPKELEEAAQIDGMSRISMFVKIILPISLPAILTQIILSFNGLYNDYMGPLLYVGANKDLWTMQILVNYVATLTSSEANYPLLMAGAIVALLPTLILYICCQKFFVDGIAMSGVKG